MHPIYRKYAIPEKIHTHPMEGHRKFVGGGGLKILEAKYRCMKLNSNFLGGWGCKTENLPWGSMDISGTAQYRHFLKNVFLVNDTGILRNLKSEFSPKESNL